MYVYVCKCVFGIYKLTATANESSLQLHRTQVEKYLIQLKAPHTQTASKQEGKGRRENGEGGGELKES